MTSIGNCRTISIGAAAIGGVLVWILLALGARGWFSSLLIAAFLAGAAALLLLALVCPGTEAEPDRSGDGVAPKGREDAAPKARDDVAPQARDEAPKVEAQTTVAPAAPKEPAPAAAEPREAKTEPATEAAARSNDTAVLDRETGGGDDLGEEVSRTEALDRDVEVEGEDHGRGAAVAGTKDTMSEMPDGVAAGMQRKPELFEAPRGSADDLKRLRGIGPKLEESLNRLGVWHFSQIAAWDEAEAAWIDEHLEGFKGRVQRDDWIRQAREIEDGPA